MSGDVRCAGSLFDALGFVVGDAYADDLPADSKTREDEAIAAVGMMLLWLRYMRAGQKASGRAAANGGRIVVAQTGAVLREIGGTVAESASVVAQWTWECPLWVLRAQRALSTRLTVDERRALARQRRAVPAAIAGATLACLSLTPIPAVLACWGAHLTVRAYYEEIARLCSAHGVEALVPDDWRHDR
jgi:hypothetical protein